MKHTLRRNAVAGIAITLVACVAAVVWAQNGRVRSQKALPGSRSSVPADTSEESVTSAAPQKPIGYYTSSVHADLFGSAEAPPISPRIVAAKVTPLAAAPKPDDPFVDYAYSGTLTFSDRVVALIENKKTRTGEYLGEGDRSLGGVIGRVTTDAVVVRIAGTDRTLAKTTDFRLTPLDRNAPQLTTNATQPVPSFGAPTPVSGAGQAGVVPDVTSPLLQGAAGDDRQRSRGRRGMGGEFGGAMGGAAGRQTFAQPPPASE